MDTHVNFDERFERVVLGIQESGEDWAEKRFTWRQLDDCTKPLLARLKGRDGATEAARERIAMASQEYLDHIKGVAVAELDMLKAKVKYDRMITQFEAYRSLCSIEKKKMNLV